MLASESHHGHSHSIIEKENEVHHNEYVDEHNLKIMTLHIQKMIMVMRRIMRSMYYTKYITDPMQHYM